MAGGNSSSSSESKLAPFDHKDSKLSDKQKFDSWLTRLRTRLGKAVGRFSSCLFHFPDPLHTDRCWGLLEQPTWCFNDDDGKVDKDHDNVNKWYKAQMHMYELILESFQLSDPQVLNDFSADAVTDRLITGTYAEGLPAKVSHAAMVLFAPFGTLCFYAIKARYEEAGTTNVIHLQSSFDQAVVFPKAQNIKKEAAIQWAQKLESAWGQLSPALQECKPEQLAGLQALVHIYQGNSEPWKQWATQLCLQHRDTPAPFKLVLAEFRRHAGLLQVAGSSGSQQSTALSAEAGKQHCATEGCNRFAAGKGKRWCNPCHAAYKAQHPLNLAPKAANALQNKKDAKRKKEFAKKKDKKGKKLATAGAAEALRATADDSDAGAKISASDMSSSDSDSEDEPSPKKKVRSSSPPGSDSDDLKDSIKVLQTWTQANLAQKRKEPAVPMSGKQRAAILKALEALQAKAVEDGIDDNDEYGCDSHVKTRFMHANTAEMEPLPEVGKKRERGFGGGGRK